jgi:hypothetical protein
MKPMTQAQIASAPATSGKYLEVAYKAPLEKVLKDKKSGCHIEEDFPLVKPAHVHYRLKSFLDADPKIAKQVRLGKTDELGVFLIYLNGDATSGNAGKRSTTTANPKTDAQTNGKTGEEAEATTTE